MSRTEKIPLRRSVGVGLLLGLAGAFTFIILEGAYFACGPGSTLFNRPGENLIFLVYLGGVLPFWGALFGIAGGALSWLVFRISASSKRFNLPAFLMALFYGLGLFAYGFIRNGVWVGLHHPSKSFLYLKFLGLASIICFPLIPFLYLLQSLRYRLVDDREGRRISILIPILTGGLICLLYAINASLYRRQYPYIHNMFILSIFWLGELFGLTIYMSGSRKKLPGAPVRIALAVLACLLCVFTFVRFDRNQNVKRIALLETPVLGKGIRWFQRVLDFDRDGYSSLLGGGDRDDGNPAVNPGAFDIPGNGIDEDGILGDRPEKHPRPSMQQQEGDPAERRLNIVFIHLDSARPANFGCYGYDRETTPRIDRLAEEGVVFSNALSPSSKTIFSMNAIMTSRYFHDTRFGPSPVTLAEVLRENGYRTAVFGPRIAFDPYPENHFVFYRGFETVELDREPARRGSDNLSEELTEKAVRFIERHRDRPFFIWLEYFDPHAPYFPGPESARWGDRTIDLYDGEIARADRLAGRFLDKLTELGLDNRTLIVVFSDNGEEFGEHGSSSHATTLYQEQVHVPLIIRVPGGRPQRRDTSVSLADLMPTVLAETGIASPGVVRGESLLAGEEESVSPQPVFLENPKPQVRKKAVLLYPWKLIYDYGYNTFELYNLEQDPGELKNVFDDNPGPADYLKKLLFSHY